MFQALQLLKLLKEAKAYLPSLDIPAIIQYLIEHKDQIASIITALLLLFGGSKSFAADGDCDEAVLKAAAMDCGCDRCDAEEFAEAVAEEPE